LIKIDRNALHVYSFQDHAWFFMDIRNFRHGIDLIDHDSELPVSSPFREDYVVKTQEGFYFPK